MNIGHEFYALAQSRLFSTPTERRNDRRQFLADIQRQNVGYASVVRASLYEWKGTNMHYKSGSEIHDELSAVPGVLFGIDIPSQPDCRILNTDHVFVCVYVHCFFVFST